MPKGVTYANPRSAPPVQGMYSHVARVAPGEIAFIAHQVAIDATTRSASAISRPRSTTCGSGHSDERQHVDAPR